MEVILSKVFTWLVTIFIVVYISYSLYFLWNLIIEGLYSFNIFKNIVHILISTLLTLFCIAGLVWFIASGTAVSLLL